MLWISKGTHNRMIAAYEARIHDLQKAARKHQTQQQFGTYVGMLRDTVTNMQFTVEKLEEWQEKTA